MVITSARLQNYRSYTDSSFEFTPGVNIIVGPNASGKTNLLDAVYFATQGKPIKKPTQGVIRHKQTWARIDVLTSTNQSRVIKSTNEGVSILIDDTVRKRLRFDDILPVVLFEPGHLYFLTTSPDMRRSYMDDLLSRIDNSFSRTKGQYGKALQQRNTLLKQPLIEVKKQIFAWDIRLSELAGNLVTKRQEIIREINNDFSGVYSSIADNKHTLSMEYDTVIDQNSYANSMLKNLQQGIQLDYHRGFTGTGPHRDDIRLIIDGNDMRDTASRGETRSILLALKIIESKIIERALHKKPMLLLDDVFGELDGVRRKALTEFIRGNQVFITTTDADIVTHDFAAQAHVISSLS